jgi:hypothetical protein
MFDARKRAAALADIRWGKAARGTGGDSCARFND